MQNVASSLPELLHINVYHFLNSITTISFDISIPLFLPFQWSSSQTAHAHIIQEGLLNPSPDVSEMLLEATTSDQDIYPYIMSFPQLAIRVPNLILVYYFDSFPRLLYLHIFFIYIDTQPSESLSQVAALDIDKLLSKTPEISERFLFNIWESLFQDWGPKLGGALPEDTMQQLLTEISWSLDTSRILIP